MTKVANALILLGGLLLLGAAAYWDLHLTTLLSRPMWSDWAVKVLNALGLGVIIAAVSTKVREWITTAVSTPGPRTSLISAEKRCERLTQCVLENPNARLFTTRYSARDIGNTDKSRQFLKALDVRIHGRKADTLRIITLDHVDKVESARSMLREHRANPQFGLKVLVPDNLRLIDLMVSEGHFACLGIETRNPNENYWIRIDDPSVANEFRNYYEKDHWGRPEAVQLKGPGVILDDTGLKTAEDRLRIEAGRAGIAGYG